MIGVLTAGLGASATEPVLCVVLMQHRYYGKTQPFGELRCAAQPVAWQTILVTHTHGDGVPWPNDDRGECTLWMC